MSARSRGVRDRSVLFQVRWQWLQLCVCFCVCVVFLVFKSWAVDEKMTCYDWVWERLARARADSRVREDFQSGNHSWNERQCREWWNSFIQGARQRWFFIYRAFWSRLKDVMCTRSMGMNQIRCSGLNQPSDELRAACVQSDAAAYGGRGKKERKSNAIKALPLIPLNHHT